MKNSKIIAIIAIVVISFCFCVNVAFADKSSIGAVNTTTVNLRAEADSSSKILIQLGEDTEVEILGTSGNWYQVEYDGINGYISKDYIDIVEEGDTLALVDEETSDEAETTAETEEDTTTADASDADNTTNDEIIEEDNLTDEETVSEETTTEDNEIATEFVLSNDAEIRTIPSFTSNKSTTIASGSKVTVLLELNKWVKITDGNVTGWAVRENIQ